MHMVDILYSSQCLKIKIKICFLYYRYYSCLPDVCIRFFDPLQIFCLTYVRQIGFHVILLASVSIISIHKNIIIIFLRFFKQKLVLWINHKINTFLCIFFRNNLMEYTIKKNCCRVIGDIPPSCTCVGGISAEPRYQITQVHSGGISLLTRQQWQILIIHRQNQDYQVKIFLKLAMSG